MASCVMGANQCISNQSAPSLVLLSVDDSYLFKKVFFSASKSKRKYTHNPIGDHWCKFNKYTNIFFLHKHFRIQINQQIRR